MKITSTFIGLLLTTGLLTAIAGLPQRALADEDLCPAVYPCDEAGELLAMFEGSSDVCAVKFAAQCKRIRTENRKSCSLVSEQYNSLQEKSEKQKIQLAKLQRKLRKLNNIKK